VLWGITAFGYANGSVIWMERPLLALAVEFLIFPNVVSDVASFASACRAISQGLTEMPDTFRI